MKMFRAATACMFVQRPLPGDRDRHQRRRRGLPCSIRSPARRDGSFPTAALMRAADGNFYGTTEDGGAFDRGTIFQMTPAGVVTVLYSFAGGAGR